MRAPLERNPISHELKIAPEYFREVKAGRKTAELRLNDRDYRIGDVLILKEFSARAGSFGGYTGKELRRAVTHITYCGQWIGEAAVSWVVLHMGVSK